MLCFVGLIVFGILGIFSATHRNTAREALSCIKDRATGSPCSTGFDEKYKAQTINFLMKHNMKLAGFVNRHFRLLNWIIFLIMAFLFVDLVISTYNYLIYGTCNPVAGYQCSIDQGRRWIDYLL